MSSPTTPGDGLPVMLFETQADFEAWVDEHHASASGAWLRLAKKASGLRSLSYDEAVEAGLCFGWIDGQKKGYDERSWLQRFTPRGPQSIWSKVNRAKAEALIAAGRVRPAGLAAVERAWQTGRWDAAYDPASTATVPEDLQAALDASERADAFFKTLAALTATRCCSASRLPRSPRRVPAASKSSLPCWSAARSSTPEWCCE